jgi:hypothetical protein
VHGLAVEARDVNQDHVGARGALLLGVGSVVVLTIGVSLGLALTF